MPNPYKRCLSDSINTAIVILLLVSHIFMNCNGITSGITMGTQISKVRYISVNNGKYR